MRCRIPFCFRGPQRQVGILFLFLFLCLFLLPWPFLCHFLFVETQTFLNAPAKNISLWLKFVKPTILSWFIVVQMLFKAIWSTFNEVKFLCNLCHRCEETPDIFIQFMEEWREIRHDYFVTNWRLDLRKYIADA